jgi:hypothetical protein
MTFAGAGPSPKTACVALQYKVQPWHSLTALRNCGSEIRRGKKSAADPVDGQDCAFMSFDPTCVLPRKRQQSRFQQERIQSNDYVIT